MVLPQIDPRAPAAHRRLYIVGGPGSGKTTLSRRLGERLGLPVIEIDAIRERGGLGHDFRPRAPLAQRRAEISAIAGQPAWITEGSALWWTDQLLGACECIIWLDLPWRLIAPRIIRRHLWQYYLRESMRAGPLQQRLGALRHPHLRELYTFTRMAHRYYRTDPGATGTPPTDVDDVRALTRAATARCLAPYTAKLIHCRRPPDLSGVIAALTATR